MSAPCGTRAGYTQHLKRNEVTCHACCDAAAAYMREWRWRTGRTKRRLVPVEEQREVAS